MKSLKNVFTLGFFAIALFFAIACGGNATESHSHDAPTATEAQQPKAQEAKEVYQCPMKCEGEKTYDEPGKCPVCGMDLKLKES